MPSTAARKHSVSSGAVSRWIRKSGRNSGWHGLHCRWNGRQCEEAPDDGARFYWYFFMWCTVVQYDLNVFLTPLGDSLVEELLVGQEADELPERHISARRQKKSCHTVIGA